MACRWYYRIPGQRDDQVKIRGYRIELGEIEAVIATAGRISQVAVVAKEKATGNKKLVAYVVGEVTNQERIMSSLRKRLPEYMIPTVWVKLESLPLTPNGKTDKKALPDIDAGESGNKYVAPRSDLEIKLAAIWEDLLGIERIGTNDNFFELGGHSLLATRTVSAVRKKLQVELAIKDLFIHPTIGELANYLGKQSTGLLLAAIGREERPVHIPLSFSQERLWFIDKLEGSIQYHIPAVLRLKGKLNKDALEYALQQIVNRHEVVTNSDTGGEWQGLPTYNGNRQLENVNR